MEPVTYTIGQLAEMLQKSELSIRRMWMRKQIPAPVSLGRVIRWRATDIDTWLKELPTSDLYEKVEHDEQNVRTNCEFAGDTSGSHASGGVNSGERRRDTDHSTAQPIQ